MGLTIGELAVQFDANTRAFDARARAVEDRVNRLEQNVSKSTSRTSAGFGRIGAAAGAAAGAISAVATAITAGVFARFAGAGLQAAAAFEQVGIQLRVLTGDAEGAQRVLADVEELVLRTPFGLQELAGAARSVSVVFGENTQAVSEFTGIAADLAAAFGRPVELIGENLTRAFSSGLGAADALREAGITAEILRITGATQVADISSRELAEALRQITSEGGKAFGAAEAQARSITGALSNTEIGFQNVQRAFGEAFAPQVVDFLVNTVQPAFGRLVVLIQENSTQIGNLAGRALRGLVTSFEVASRAVGFLIRVFGFMVDAVQALRVSFASVQEGVIRTINLFRRFAAVPALIRGNVAEAAAVLRELEVSNEAAAGATADAFKVFAEGTPVIDGLADGLEALARTILGVSNSSAAATAATDENTAATGRNSRANLDNLNILQRRTAEQVKLAAELQKAVAEGRQGPLTGLAAEIAALDEEIRQVGALNVAEADRALQAERLNQLAERRVELAQQLARAQDTLPSTIAAVNEQIAALAELDPEAAAKFATDLQEALVGAAGDPRAQVQGVAEVAQAVREAAASAAGPSLGDEIAASVGDGFRRASQGEAVNLADSVGSALFERATDSLDRAFADAVGGLGDLLEGVLSAASSAASGLFDGIGLTGEGGLFSGLGEGAGKLLGDAAVGIIGSGLRALSRDDQITSSAGNVRSAVDSAERVRGIVAGPTQIAVAQVDRAIADAFVETNSILLRSEGLLRRIASRIGGGPAGSLDAGPSESTTILANEGATLA